MSNKQKALVICPGRGTYNATELAYLTRYHGDKQTFIERCDAWRQEAGQTSLSELDGRARYSLKEHTRGDNASALIWACAQADFMSIDRDRFDIAAITGNSMGWYIALGCAGSLTEQQAFDVVNTMGTLMQESLIGGQLIYPEVDENWREIPGRREALDALTCAINDERDCELYLSIKLGGLRVFGGNAVALTRLQEALAPEQGRYPLQLHNHAAFHTPLLSAVAAAGRERLPAVMFSAPTTPLIDGRGAQWLAHSTHPEALWHYTLSHQVCEAYDFTRAIQVAVKEHAPDRIIILGPGTTLGGAVAQSLIAIRWQGWQCKQDFIDAQQEQPYLVSMGMDEQRKLVVAAPS